MNTIPEDLADLLTSDRIGHVSSVRPDGSISTHLMWVDWDGEHVLTSSPVGSRKSQNWRRNPQVSVSVADANDPWRYLIIRGRVTDTGRMMISPSLTRCRSATLAHRISGAALRERSS